MSTTLDVKINVRCTTGERNRFHRAAMKAGDTPSSVLRRLMLDYTKGRITYPPHQETR